MKNELARTLFLAGEKVQYDAQCKKVLSHKVILAWILKYTMEEFREFSVETIITCIEENPEISAIQAGTGGKAAERILGSRNESSGPDEGTIYYDIRFSVYVPRRKESVRMLINLEAQKAFRPGYEIVTRGVYYAARMLSEQLGTEFSVPNYDGLKKVCSIWICMNAPQYIGNTLASYSLSKLDLEGQQPDMPEAYNKMEICIVTLNQGMEADSKFLQMLNVLLSVNRSYEEKERLLKTKFRIKMDADLRKELNLMCNLSEYVYESGEKSGMKRGIKRGMRQGRKEEKKDVVKAMLEEGYPKAAILKIARVTPEEYEKWKTEKLS